MVADGVRGLDGGQTVPGFIDVIGIAALLSPAHCLQHTPILRNVNSRNEIRITNINKLPLLSTVNPCTVPD